jgi:hypothetical protein
MTPEPSDQDCLPPYLKESPTEIEDIPLQVALLTMELATQRQAMAKLATLAAALAAIFTTLAQAVEPPSLPPSLLDPEGSDGRREGNDHH